MNQKSQLDLEELIVDLVKILHGRQPKADPTKDCLMRHCEDFLKSMSKIDGHWRATKKESSQCSEMTCHYLDEFLTFFNRAQEILHEHPNDEESLDSYNAFVLSHISLNASKTM